MTGYGAATVSSGHYHITAEMKSVNAKFLEIFFRLPPHYFEQEIRLKNRLGPRLTRGKISVALTVESSAPDDRQHAPINEAALSAYYRQLREIAENLGAPAEIRLDQLLELPNVVGDPKPEVDDEEWRLVAQAVDQAADKLLESRAKEGAALREDLLARNARLGELLDGVEPLAPGRIDELKNRLKTSLEQLAEAFNMSEDRYNQEVIYYLERYDITEEQVRLRAHFQNFYDTLHDAAADYHGRKLFFIMQEVHREVNTLGVKSYDAGIQEITVKMKEEVEKIKEQLMNIV